MNSGASKNFRLICTVASALIVCIIVWTLGIYTAQFMDKTHVCSTDTDIESNDVVELGMPGIVNDFNIYTHWVDKDGIRYDSHMDEPAVSLSVLQAIAHTFDYEIWFNETTLEFNLKPLESYKVPISELEGSWMGQVNQSGKSFGITFERSTEFGPYSFLRLNTPDHEDEEDILYSGFYTINKEGFLELWYRKQEYKNPSEDDATLAPLDFLQQWTIISISDQALHIVNGDVDMELTRVSE